MSETDIQSFIPLRPDVFTILLVLLDGDCHGYGMIEPLAADDAPDDADERRRYYRIAPFGRQVAAAEAQRMADLVELSAKHRLLEQERAS